MGEVLDGLPGSTLERGMRGEERQELGRPWWFLSHRNGRGKRAQGIRILSHGGGNPETEVGRTLNAVEAAPGG